VNKTNRHRIFWTLLALVGLIATASAATTLSRLSFDELVHHSSVVARLRCVRVDVLTERGEIWTDTLFQVMRQDKGFTSSPIVVRMPGGKMQNLTSHVEGVPQFRPGEEVYLFLVLQPGKQFHILGWSQGTFRIHKNPRTGMETVTQDSADLPVFDPQARSFTRTGIQNLTMDRFLEQLHRQL